MSVSDTLNYIISCFFHNYDMKIVLFFTRFHTWDTKIRVSKKKMPAHIHESKALFKKLIQCQCNAAGMFCSDCDSTSSVHCTAEQKWYERPVCVSSALS